MPTNPWSLASSRKRPPPQPSPAAQDSPSSGSRFVSCPVCNRSVAFSLINDHLDAGCVGGTEPESTPSSSAPAAAPPAAAPPAVAASSTAATPATAAAPPRGGGAFAVMMGTARQAAKVLPCSLVRDGDGRLAVVWTALGADDVGWSAECQLKNGTAHPTRVRLGASRAAVGGGEAADPFADQPDHGLSASLLKSALQKNVRRCRADAAVKCAWALLRLEGDGVSQLLRRLPVIAVEDALPPPRSFAILVWLMAAHAKGFTLGRAHVDEVMSFARAIAATRARDDSPQDDGGGDGDGPRLGDDGVATGGGDMVRAMLLRAAFGGMEGDIAMLHRAAATWQRRWARAEAAWADGLAVAFGGAAAAADGVMSGEAPLMVTDIPPAAVDFHCSSVLESVLEQPAVRDALLARGGGDIDGLRAAGNVEVLVGSVAQGADSRGRSPGPLGRRRRGGRGRGGGRRRRRQRRRVGLGGGGVEHSARAVCRVCAEARRWEAAPRRGPGGGAARAAAAAAAAARRDGRARRRRGGRPSAARGGGLGGRRSHPPRSAAGDEGAGGAPGVARLLHRGGLCECGGGGGAPRIPRRPRVRRGVGVSGTSTGRRAASGGA